MSELKSVYPLWEFMEYVIGEKMPNEYSDYLTAVTEEFCKKRGYSFMGEFQEFLPSGAYRMVFISIFENFVRSTSNIIDWAKEYEKVAHNASEDDITYIKKLQHSHFSIYELTSVKFAESFLAKDILYKNKLLPVSDKISTQLLDEGAKIVASIIEKDDTHILCHAWIPLDEKNVAKLKKDSKRNLEKIKKLNKNQLEKEKNPQKHLSNLYTCSLGEEAINLYIEMKYEEFQNYGLDDELESYNEIDYKNLTDQELYEFLAEESAQLSKEELDATFKEVIEMELPEFNNRTLIETAKSKTGKKKVEAWIKQLEKEFKKNSINYDFNGLREKLGLKQKGEMLIY